MSARRRLSLPRSMSLAAQLLLTFVTLLALATTVLGIAAYNSSLESLKADASRAVRVAAEMRDETMTRLFTTRRARAEGFLAGMESLCGELRSDGAFGWALECVAIMVEELRTTEAASGVHVMYQGHLLAVSGTTSSDILQPGAIASIVRRRDGGSDFSIVATRGALVATVQFDSAEIDALFAQRAGLAESGEAFLTDGAGRPLTPLRYAEGDGVPPGFPVAEATIDCSTPREVLDYDYRGRMTIHSVRPATVLDSGCIHAHVRYDEALAPSDALRDDLVLRGITFVLIGAVLSVIAARRIAAPVRRLAESARQIQSGRFADPVPIGGPSEVRALGSALAAMATEIDKLVRREQAARRDAEAANRSKDHFLATLSHELRTPLNAIFGWSRLLRTGNHDAERLERATIAIERSAESLRRLVDDLLDVSRIISGRLRLVRAPLRLATAAEAALDAVRPQALERGVRLETDIPSADIIVLGDQQRLQQVVWNLLWNAIKFTPEGGVVRLSLAETEDRATIEVTDTGVGIPPESLPHIFGWFQQAEAGTRAVDAGLGVGLALVRQIVELHGGAVTAESEGAGSGATFRVRLPLADHAALTAADDLADANGQIPKPLQGVRVLMVEDDREWREAAVALLTEAGAQVEAVSTAAEARAAVKAAAPDVLVSDIAMPDEDGYALMASLRQQGARIPSIALTGLARREDAEKARAAGFLVHMSKPVDPERLVETIAAVANPNRRKGR